MKNFRLIAGICLAVLIATISFNVRADGTNSVSPVKPDLLTTCPVSGDKLGADMGQALRFCLSRSGSETLLSDVQGGL